MNTTSAPIIDAAAEASSKSWRALAKAMHESTGRDETGRSTGARYGIHYATAGYVTIGAYGLQVAYVSGRAVRKALQARGILDQA